MSKKLNVCFCGSSEFSIPFFYYLNKHPNIAVQLILTQPDKLAHRGKRLTSNPFKRCVLPFNIPIIEPYSLKDPETQHTLKNSLHSLKIDAVVVVSYGLIVPKTLLDLPKFGWINVHASLLPKWRGAAPIARAVLSGDKISGISIMRMDSGCDTGPYFLQKSCIIDPDDDSASLSQKLVVLGISSLKEFFEDLLGSQRLKEIPQNHKFHSYAEKLSKKEAQIDWSEPTLKIDRKIKAYFPWPIAWFEYNHEKIKVFKSVVVNSFKFSKINTSYSAGTILENAQEGLTIRTLDGAITLTQLQFPNRKIQDWKVLRHQQKLRTWKVGTCLTSPRH